jgi:hypothetical protein
MNIILRYVNAVLVHWHIKLVFFLYINVPGAAQAHIYVTYPRVNQYFYQVHHFLFDFGNLVQLFTTV